MAGRRLILFVLAQLTLLVGALAQTWREDGSFPGTVFSSQLINSALCSAYPGGKWLVPSRDPYFLVNRTRTANTWVRLTASGELDPTFGCTVIGEVLAVSTDGKIYFRKSTYITPDTLIRLLPSGALDTSFEETNFQGFFGFKWLNGDGSCFVADDNGLRKLRTNGGTDTSFTPFKPQQAFIQSAVVDSANRVLVHYYQGNKRAVVRLLSNGGLDSSFTETEVDGDPRQLWLSSSGTLFASNGKSTVKFFPNGGIDGTFTSNHAPATGWESYVVFSEGSVRRPILVDEAVSGSGLRRIADDGKLDTSFNVTSGGAFGWAASWDNASYLVSGHESEAGYLSGKNLLAYSSSGVLDTTFAGRLERPASVGFYAANDRTLVAVSGTSFAPEINHTGLAYFNSDGTFLRKDALLPADLNQSRITPLESGNLLVDYQLPNSTERKFVVLRTDGTMEPTFLPSTQLASPDYTISGSDPVGQLYLTNSTGQLHRFRETGAFDRNLGNLKFLLGLTGGKFYALSEANEVRRYNSDGSVDSSFQPVLVNGSCAASSRVFDDQSFVLIQSGGMLGLNGGQEASRTSTVLYQHIHPSGQVLYSYQGPIDRDTKLSFILRCFAVSGGTVQRLGGGNSYLIFDFEYSIDGFSYLDWNRDYTIFSNGQAYTEASRLLKPAEALNPKPIATSGIGINLWRGVPFEPFTNQPFIMSVSAKGAYPMSYWWYKDNTLVSVTASNTLGRGAPTKLDLGTYRVRIVNAFGETWADPLVLQENPAYPLPGPAPVTPAPTPADSGAPIIVSGPKHTSAAFAWSAVLGVQAIGPDLKYQWLKNGEPLPRVVTSTLWFTSVGETDAAEYSVVVSNAYGSVTSAPARLSIVSPTSTPKLLENPLPQVATPGSRVEFWASSLAPTSSLTSGSSAEAIPRYEWFKNGKPIPGATDQGIALNDVTLADQGDYTVKITYGSTTLTSRPARLTVGSVKLSRLSNLSVRTVAGIDKNPLIVGFAVKGGAKEALLRGVGPSLEQFKVGGTMPDPKLVLFKHQGDTATEVASNDNWSDNADVAGLSARAQTLGAFAFASGVNRDSAFITTLTGSHSVHVNDTQGRSGVVLAEVYDAEAGTDRRLFNLSARSRAGSGDQSLILGFNIDGNQPRTVVIRAVGPTLKSFGIATALTDPVLTLHGQSFTGEDVIIAQNDDWGTEPNATASFKTGGAFELPTGSKDSALVVTLPGGSYTAVVSSKDNSSGEALVEVYEVTE